MQQAKHDEDVDRILVQVGAFFVQSDKVDATNRIHKLGDFTAEVPEHLLHLPPFCSPARVAVEGAISVIPVFTSADVQKGTVTHANLTDTYRYLQNNKLDRCSLSNRS